MSRIIFTKYSNERARRFALRTDIVQEGERRYVNKKAAYPEGEGHIRDIDRWYQELERRYAGTRIRINRCGLQEDKLILEYLEGPTLEQILDGYLLEGNTTQLVDHLFEYLEEVRRGFTRERFAVTPEFVRVFGEADLPEDLLSADVADVDMVLNNIIVADGWNLIDYEWTFAFPVPYHFVVYRILTYYLNGSSTRSCLHSLGLMERAGLTEEEIAVYEKMERHFQDVYVVSDGADGELFVPIRDLYDAISPGEVDLKSLRVEGQSEQAARMVQLYQSPDGNFAEDRSEKKKTFKEGIFLNYFSVEPDSRFVRLDPCAKYCILRNLQMQWGPEIRSYRTNGFPREDESIFFATDDPQIIVERPEDAAGDFRAYFEVEYLTAEDALYELSRMYSRQRAELCRTRDILTQREEKIGQMENTKVWKAYRKIKRNET